MHPRPANSMPWRSGHCCNRRSSLIARAIKRVMRGNAAPIGREAVTTVFRRPAGRRTWNSNLGHEIARSTIAGILQRHGIEPAPERNRKTTWKEFLKRHWDVIVAADFFTVEVWTRHGLQRFIVAVLH